MKRNVDANKHCRDPEKLLGNMKLTDSDVEMIRELHEVHRLSYAKLAVKFEVSLSAINKICRYVRRTGQRQTANAFR